MEATYVLAKNGVFSPAVVELSSFTVEAYRDYVEVEWITVADIDNDGFNVYRSPYKDGDRSLLNEKLIPAKGDEFLGASYTFIDRDVTCGVTYSYWLEDIDLRGGSSMHGPVSVTVGSSDGGNETQVPGAFSLDQNHPNPFNPVTEIRYGLPVDCRVRLDVYDVMGLTIFSLVNECQEAGNKVIHWDGRNARGLSIDSGIYFYRLQAGTFTCTKKMVLMK